MKVLYAIFTVPEVLLMEKRIKVGFLPLYIKLYDDSFGPAYREPMEDCMNTCIRLLEEQGIEIVSAGQICRIAPEFEAAISRFQQEDVDAVITMHLAYSPSLESIGALKRLNVPIIVLDTTYHYALLEAANTENRIGPNHGIHGVQDMCNLLKRNHIPYYICAGHALHSNVITKVAGLCRVASAVKAFRTMKIGSAGGCFAGMGDFQIPDDRFQQDIGAEVHYLTPDIAKAYLQKVTDEEIEAEIREDATKYNVEVTWMEAYQQTIKASLAVRKWMQDLSLGAFTMNFLTTDTCGLPKAPFLECCKILERGQGYAGEGDVLTAGLVGALFHAYENVTFTEMFCPDWKENLILLNHMGECNPKLSQGKPLLHNMPFTFNSCGDTVSLSNCGCADNVTIVNLAPLADGFNLILCPGKIIAAPEKHSAYRTSIQSWFQPALPLEMFLQEYSLAGGTHHSAMVYDADLGELKDFGKMMGFHTITIE